MCETLTSLNRWLRSSSCNSQNKVAREIAELQQKTIFEQVNEPKKLKLAPYKGIHIFKVAQKNYLQKELFVFK